MSPDPLMTRDHLTQQLLSVHVDRFLLCVELWLMCLESGGKSANLLPTPGASISMLVGAFYYWFVSVIIIFRQRGRCSNCYYRSHFRFCCLLRAKYLSIIFTIAHRQLFSPESIYCITNVSIRHKSTGTVEILFVLNFLLM